MSWETFKQNILRVANSPEGISDIDVVAESYAKEYDSAVKRGFDRQHSIPLVSGNVEMMKIFFKSALQKGLTASQPYDLVGEMGEGVKAYWAGAVMATAPIPIQPAPGSTSNIQVTQNTITDVGIWKQPQSSANTEPNFELSNERRAEVQEQLERATTNYNTAVTENRTVDASTLEDEINKCESILIENEEYRITIPPLENKINSAAIEPTTTTTTTAAPTSTYVTPTPNPSDPVQTQEEIDAELAAFLTGDTTTEKISSGQNEGFKWNQGKPFVQGFKAGGGIGGGGYGGSFNQTYPPPTFPPNATIGLKAVLIAQNDEANGVKEIPKESDSGHARIIEMHKNGGCRTPNPWCACAVTTWWQEAGIVIPSGEYPSHPNKAYVPTWVKWAIANGRWVSKLDGANPDYVPNIGDAIVYGWGSMNNDHGGMDHIGMVLKVDKGTVYGIDGNYSAAVTTHIANPKTIRGYIIIG
jgi:hypothetical protein